MSFIIKIKLRNALMAFIGKFLVFILNIIECFELL